MCDNPIGILAKMLGDWADELVEAQSFVDERFEAHHIFQWTIPARLGTIGIAPGR